MNFTRVELDMLRDGLTQLKPEKQPDRDRLRRLLQRIAEESIRVSAIDRYRKEKRK